MGESADLYQKLYTTMFNAVTEALEELDAGHARQAGDLLRRAQCRTEELYMDWDQNGANSSAQGKGKRPLDIFPPR